MRLLSKESNGVGSFRTTKSGKYEYRIPYYDEHDVRREKSFTAKSKAKCLDRADEFLRMLEIKKGGVDIFATIPSILYKKVQRDYMKNYTGEQGYDRNLQTIKIIADSMIGKLKIIEIQKYQIEEFLWYITKYSNGVISKVYSMLKNAFEIAYDEKLISKNIMKDKDLRKPHSYKKDKKVRGFTEEEQEIYVKALKNHKVPYGRNSYKNQLLIELYTGMRMGEINALTAEDINFEKRFIRVNKTIARGINNKAFLNNTTKTKAGERSVPISKVAEPILKDAVANMQDNPYNLVFYDYVKNGLIETSQVNSLHKRICEKAGVENLGQHSLRHTFATRCIEAEIPPVTLKNWLGHTNIHITLDVYSDVYDRMTFKSIAKYEILMDKVMSNEDEDN